jgi:hypothetical protein
MFDTFLAQATSLASIAVAITLDTAATLTLLANIVLEWTSVVPGWAVLVGSPVLIGLTLPVLHEVRARRSNGARAARVRRARRSRMARTTPRHRGHPAVSLRPPSPAVLARELVRQGLPAVEVCLRTRLSLDAVSLVMRAAANRSSRQDRPGAAPLAAPVAPRAMGEWSGAAA